MKYCKILKYVELKISRHKSTVFSFIDKVKIFLLSNKLWGQTFHPTTSISKCWKCEGLLYFSSRYNQSLYSVNLKFKPKHQVSGKLKQAWYQMCVVLEWLNLFVYNIIVQNIGEYSHLDFLEGEKLGKWPNNDKWISKIP